MRNVTSLKKNKQTKTKTKQAVCSDLVNVYVHYTVFF